MQILVLIIFPCFIFNTESAIYVSPTVLEYENDLMIFFSNNEGEIFAVDINGNLYDGFPINLMEQGVLLPFNAISESIIFEDFDMDGIPEIIFGDENGNLNILKSSDSTFSDFYYYNNMPISNTFAYSSSVITSDLDNDGDVEIIGGTTGDLIVIDIKEESDSDYWNIYRANYYRNGYYISSTICTAGDINNDGVLDILDIVSMINIIIDSSELTDSEFCASDMNSDNIIDILDIVTLINAIMDN